MKRRVMSWFNHGCLQGDQRPVELLLRPTKPAVVPRRRMDISCPGALPSRRTVLHIHENMANKFKGILPRIVAQVTPATARSGTAGEWELQRGILEVSLTPKLEDASHRYNTSCRHPPTILYEQGGDPHTYTRRRMSLSFSLLSLVDACSVWARFDHTVPGADVPWVCISPWESGRSAQEAWGDLVVGGRSWRLRSLRMSPLQQGRKSWCRGPPASERASQREPMQGDRPMVLRPSCRCQDRVWQRAG